MNYSVSKPKYKVGGKVAKNATNKKAKRVAGEVAQCKKGMKCAGKLPKAPKYKTPKPPKKSTPKDLPSIKKIEKEANYRAASKTKKQTKTVQPPTKSVKATISPTGKKTYAKGYAPKDKADYKKDGKKAYLNKEGSSTRGATKTTVSSTKTMNSKAQKKKDKAQASKGYSKRPASMMMAKGGKVKAIAKGTPKAKSASAARTKADARTTMLQGYGYKKLSPMEAKKLKKMKAKKSTKMKTAK
jgi:hypothetical protein